MTKSDLVLQENSQPTRADALKNRALILKTAARLFAERGVADVLIQDIADAAEVGKGTFYRNFPNGKTDLCLALLDEDQRDLQERSLEHFRSHSDPLANLRWFLVEVLHFVD